MEDLDDRFVQRYLTEVRSSSRRLADVSDDEILRRKGVVRETMLTTAGAYAMGAFPQEFEPSLSITAAVQLPREAGARTRDLQHMDGPLPELLSQAMEWVRRNTQTTIRVGEDGRARDSNEIPLVAVRELVANALVHRDLGPHTRGKRVEIRLLEDKLVISNPGGLYGISSEQLGSPEGKSAVNEFLYDLCKYTRTAEGDRVIEGEGGGIREVVASLRTAGLAPPHFIDKGISFTVVVPRHALLPLDDVAWLASHDSEHRLSAMEGQILSSMRHGQVWSNAGVRAEFPGLDSREAHRALAHLVDLGFAEAVGQRGGRQYRLHPRWNDASASVSAEVTVTGHTGQAERDSLPSTASRADPGPPHQGTPTNKRNVRETPAEKVIDALKTGPLPLRSITEVTGLTGNSARYALKRLIGEQRVEVDGGWGVRGTTYRFRRAGAAD